MQPQLGAGAGAEQPQVGAGAGQHVGAGQHFLAAILAFNLASKPCLAHGSQQGAGSQHGAGAGVQHGAGAGAGAQHGAGAGAGAQQVGAGSQHLSFLANSLHFLGAGQQVGAGSQQGAGCAHGSQHLFLPSSPAFATLPNAKHITSASRDSLRFLMGLTPVSRVFGKLGEILTAHKLRSTTGKRYNYPKIERIKGCSSSVRAVCNSPKCGYLGHALFFSG